VDADLPPRAPRPQPDLEPTAPLRALRKFEIFYNEHRPQGIANARPLEPLPSAITEPGQIAHLNIRRTRRLGGILNEYENAA
jgi:hypothetical protein